MEIGGYTISPATAIYVEGAAGESGNDGVMGFGIANETLYPIAEANGYDPSLVDRMADLDTDGDGTNDALSIGFVFTSVPCGLSY
jgi:hypothetical protein